MSRAWERIGVEKLRASRTWMVDLQDLNYQFPRYTHRSTETRLFPVQSPQPADFVPPDGSQLGRQAARPSEPATDQLQRVRNLTKFHGYFRIAGSCTS
jgi:hypothetical protein